MLHLALRECIAIDDQKVCPRAVGSKSKHHHSLFVDQDIHEHHPHSTYGEHQEVRKAMPYREEGHTQFHDVYSAPLISHEHYLV